MQGYLRSIVSFTLLYYHFKVVELFESVEDLDPFLPVDGEGLAPPSVVAEEDKEDRHSLFFNGPSYINVFPGITADGFASGEGAPITGVLNGAQGISYETLVTINGKPISAGELFPLNPRPVPAPPKATNIRDQPKSNGNSPILPETNQGSVALSNAGFQSGGDPQLITTTTARPNTSSTAAVTEENTTVDLQRQTGGSETINLPSGIKHRPQPNGVKPADSPQPVVHPNSNSPVLSGTYAGNLQIPNPVLSSIDSVNPNGFVPIDVTSAPLNGTTTNQPTSSVPSIDENILPPTVDPSPSGSIGTQAPVVNSQLQQKVPVPGEPNPYPNLAVLLPYRPTKPSFGFGSAAEQVPDDKVLSKPVQPSPKPLPEQQHCSNADYSRILNMVDYKAPSCKYTKSQIADTAPDFWYDARTYQHSYEQHYSDGRYIERPLAGRGARAQHSHNCTGQTLIKVLFPVVANMVAMPKLKLDIYMAGVVSGYSFHVSDGPNNFRFPEIRGAQVVGGYKSELMAYLNTEKGFEHHSFEDGRIFNRHPSFKDRNHLTMVIGDMFFHYTDHAEKDVCIVSPNLFLLTNQPRQFEVARDNYIYIGINRAVHSEKITGTGVCTITLTWV